LYQPSLSLAGSWVSMRSLSFHRRSPLGGGCRRLHLHLRGLEAVFRGHKMRGARFFFGRPSEEWGATRKVGRRTYDKTSGAVHTSCGALNTWCDADDTLSGAVITSCGADDTLSGAVISSCDALVGVQEFSCLSAVEGPKGRTACRTMNTLVMATQSWRGVVPGAVES
jgi:hypothetical protein